MIRSVYFDNGDVQFDLKPEEYGKALENPRGLLWVSLEQASEEEMNTILNDVFGFHPLAVEDCMSAGYQTPKVDDYEEHIFIIVNALHANFKEDKEIETSELDMFLGKNYLVTIYKDVALAPVDLLWKRLDRNQRIQKRGVDFLCHSLIDILVDDYIPVLDHMDDEIEWLEDKVLEKPEPIVLQRILLLKHNVMSLRRILAPLRDVVNRLSRGEFDQIDEQAQIYFRDVYDHLVRMQDLSESLRDIVTGALDIYLSSTSLRLNEIMKALTVVSTIFLPLTFIAGVYGMNFKFLPEVEWLWGYPMTWGIFIVIAVGMLIFFKKRGWF